MRRVRFKDAGSIGVMENDQTTSVMQDDLGRILIALGLSDYARPASPHDVVITEVLPAIARLRRKKATANPRVVLLTYWVRLKAACNAARFAYTHADVSAIMPTLTRKLTSGEPLSPSERKDMTTEVLNSLDRVINPHRRYLPWKLCKWKP